MKINFKNTSYDFSFKSDKQMPLFMISKEYYINNKLDFAKVIFEIKGKDCRRKLKKFFDSQKELWDNSFDMERTVNGKNIIVGKQNFITESILIKDKHGIIINCPMYQNDDGEIYFIYDNTGVYISEYMGEFAL